MSLLVLVYHLDEVYNELKDNVKFHLKGSFSGSAMHV